jgi:hypothetical protein
MQALSTISAIERVIMNEVTITAAHAAWQCINGVAIIRSLLSVMVLQPSHVFFQPCSPSP